MQSLKEKLIEAVEQIPGVENRPSPVAGGSALHYKGREFAHFHNDNELDLKLTKKLIKQEGIAHPENSEIHPGRAPSSQWIELRFNQACEVEKIAMLVKLAVNAMAAS